MHTTSESIENNEDTAATCITFSGWDNILPTIRFQIFHWLYENMNFHKTTQTFHKTNANKYVKGLSLFSL